MPFKPVAQNKCPKCDKSVYAAEERAVGDLKFHKDCYKCSMCNKMLDSTNMNCHETVLYCKTCHGRKYGPKGYGFGGGAAGLSMDTGAHLDYGREDSIKEYKAPKATPGEGCPRCGGKVYAAEEMLAKGKTYHRTCFNCKTCRKPLDSMLHCDGPDKEVYCKACYTKKFGLRGYGFGQGMGTLTSCDPEINPMVRPHGNPEVYAKPQDGEDACPRCGGKVYSAEMMLAKGRPFHKRCFKCRACKRPLDSMNHCDGSDGDVYCRLCYAKKYGPKGYGFAAGSGGVLTAENIPGGDEGPVINPASAALDVSLIRAAEGEGCPRCGGKVFMAEEMLAKGKSYHKRCFNCVHCHRPLDSVVGCDAPDGQIYCKLCYAKRFGPKGYGFSSGGGGVMSAENLGGDEDTHLKSKIAFTCLDVSKIQAAEGDGCPRCGGKVFMAEEIHARGRSWHKSCYHCCHCRRPLDSVVGCDAPDGEVYCKLCYAKKFGPKGYGFSAGAGGVLTAENIPGGDETPEVNPASVAIDTTAILAAPGEGCPRCGGKVFSAEEMLSRGHKWHKRCYNCCSCRRPLDSMLLCDGPDGDIYCKLCYGKKFGPKGYGFASGAGGVLFPESIIGNSEIEEATVLSSGPAYVTQSDIKNMTPAREGQSRCPRCGGAVFQAESMSARNKEWHKQCYNCVECHRPLDSMIGCDAPDGEIYCKLCYAKRHGPKGYGYGQTATLVSLGTEDGSPMPSDIRQFGFGVVGAKQFLEGAVTSYGGDRLEDGQGVDSTSHRTIVNQIKNLPFAGRVPRGVEQADKGKLPWLSEDEDAGAAAKEGSGKGFRGFPSKKMTRTWQEALPEEQETTMEGGKKIITTKRVIRQVEETTSSSSSSVQTVQHQQQGIESSRQIEGRNIQEEEEEEEEEEVFENEEQNAIQLPDDDDDDDEQVETSDFTTQTSPLPSAAPKPPTNSAPQLNNGPAAPQNAPEEVAALASDMQGKMNAVSMEMQNKREQQSAGSMSQLAEATDAANQQIEQQQSAGLVMSQQVAQSSETKVTEHVEERHESQVEFSSKTVSSSKFAESSQFEAVSGAEVEVSGQVETVMESRQVHDETHNESNFAE